MGSAGSGAGAASHHANTPPQSNCAICRNSLYGPSIEHQALGISEVTIAWGVCNHCFHLGASAAERRRGHCPHPRPLPSCAECIQRWLKTRNVCPLCGREWEFQKIQKVA